VKSNINESEKKGLNEGSDRKAVDEDHDTIRRILNHSPNEYRWLVDKYQTAVYNLTLRMLNNTFEAEEVTQAVFVKAYEALPSFRFEYRFFSWLYRIAVNMALNQLKKRKKFTGLEQVETRMQEPGTGEQDKSAHILMAVDRLKDKYKTVVSLKYFEEKSYRDIAWLLGIEEKKVRSRLYDARVQLREILEKTGYY
jgi:RNA polymerase sigma-70 factor, ECF subfamily